MYWLIQTLETNFCWILYLQVKVRPHCEQRFFKQCAKSIEKGSLYFVRWYLSDYLCKIWTCYKHTLIDKVKFNNLTLMLDERHLWAVTHYVVNILSTMRWFLHFNKTENLEIRNRKITKKTFFDLQGLHLTCWKNFSFVVKHLIFDILQLLKIC